MNKAIKAPGKLSADAWTQGELLSAVVTLREACDCWGMSRSAILNRINTDKLEARRSGPTWLITARSMYWTYGRPESPVGLDSSVYTE